MRPKERRDSGQSDFFKARLDQIVGKRPLDPTFKGAGEWGTV